MIYWLLCLAGWIVLWFQPRWLWLVAASLIVALPGPIIALVFMQDLGIPLPQLMRNVTITLVTGLATFAVPGTAIVLLRQFMQRAASKDPAPPQ